jgi:hypothetical protein
MSNMERLQPADPWVAACASQVYDACGLGRELMGRLSDESTKLHQLDTKPAISAEVRAWPMDCLEPSPMCPATLVIQLAMDTSMNIVSRAVLAVPGTCRP